MTARAAQRTAAGSSSNIGRRACCRKMPSGHVPTDLLWPRTVCEILSNQRVFFLRVCSSSVFCLSLWGTVYASRGPHAAFSFSLSWEQRPHVQCIVHLSFFFLDSHFSRFSLEPLGSCDFFLAIEILYQAEPNSELMYTKKMTLQEQSFSFFNGLKLNSLD